MSRIGQAKTTFAAGWRQSTAGLASLLAVLCLFISPLSLLAEQEAHPDKVAPASKELPPGKDLQNIQGTQENKQPDDKSPELKPGLPKLDVHKPEKSAPVRRPLKGSIQHSERIHANKQLNGNVGEGTLDYRKGKDSLKGRLGRGQIRGGLAQTNDSGLGIIGVKFIMGFGRPPVINRVFPGTPAAEAGVRPRDIIIAVDGIPTFGLSKDEVYNMIVGQPGTEVTISVEHNRNFQVHKLMRMDLYQIPDPQVRRDYLNM